MNSEISKKVIFASFLFVNFIQPSKSAEFFRINKNDTNLNTQPSKSVEFFRINKNDTNLNTQQGFSKILKSKKSSNSSFNNNFEQNFIEKDLKLVADLSEKKEELVIQSDKQSEINNVIYSEGNVTVSYEGKLLKADNLVYDKINKRISAKGNISLLLGDQIFKVSKLEYSFISNKGYLLDVKGSINTNTLMNDLFSNFSYADSNKIENILELKKRKF